MRLKSWYRARGPRFVLRRAAALQRRYGLTPTKAVRRIEQCVATLAEQGCSPTFPTPGVVVQRYPQTIRRFQEAGAEIAVHSYEHIDLAELPVAEALRQLMRAVEVFAQAGIEVRGFRCPYMSMGDALPDALPPGLFDYSSNAAVCWELDGVASGGSEFFETLRRFYHGKPAAAALSLPVTHPNLIEIPASVPDDLQLHDGLHLEGDGIAQVWCTVLGQVHRRGELFTLLFHPELAAECDAPFAELLRAARRLDPPVWVARLRDVSDWWREKAGFSVETSPIPGGMRLTFVCSPRAAILVRGLNGSPALPWCGADSRLLARVMDLPAGPLPFVGVDASAPAPAPAFLRDLGYIVETGSAARRCALCLDAAAFEVATPVQIVSHIEAFPGPLVRYARWPAGAKCALSVTGDLDALTLFDYAGRLFAH